MRKRIRDLLDARAREQGKSQVEALGKRYSPLPEKISVRRAVRLILFLRQKKRCAVCGVRLRPKTRFALDHHHVTGQVRGILCLRCNWLIGAMEANAGIIQKAYEYIEKHGTPLIDYSSMESFDDEVTVQQVKHIIPAAMGTS